MRGLYRLSFTCLSVGMVAWSLAQSPYDEEVCLDKTLRQLRREEQKRNFNKGISKTLQAASYLNYSDRTVDRVITGREAFEPYRGKIIRNIEIKVLDPYGV